MWTSMWTVMWGCWSGPPPAEAPTPTVAEPQPDEPAPAIPVEDSKRAFEAWVEPGAAGDDGARSLSFDLTEASLAEALDARPIVYEALGNSPSDGRVGWIVEAYSPPSPAPERRWRIRMLQMGEHYAHCASDGEWPMFRGPTFDAGGIRFVAEQPDNFLCAEIRMRPQGDLVEVEACGHTFVARPRDALSRRYAAARDAWASAEIERLNLRRGSAPNRIVRGGVEFECFPADLVAPGADGDRLLCDRGAEAVWFDTDGRARETVPHNECGWFAIVEAH